MDIFMCITVSNSYKLLKSFYFHRVKAFIPLQNIFEVLYFTQTYYMFIKLDAIFRISESQEYWSVWKVPSKQTIFLKDLTENINVLLIKI